MSNVSPSRAQLKSKYVKVGMLFTTCGQRDYVLNR